jgi:hypothetical protein
MNMIGGFNCPPVSPRWRWVLKELAVRVLAIVTRVLMVVRRVRVVITGVLEFLRGVLEAVGGVLEAVGGVWVVIGTGALGKVEAVLSPPTNQQHNHQTVVMGIVLVCH